MTVAVTGADGFAGSHLVDLLLARGEHIVACVRATPLKNLAPSKNVKIAYADIGDYKSLLSAFWGCDAVYHLAAVSGIAESRAKPSATLEANVIGTQNVLEACVDQGVHKVLYTSTCHVAGYDIYAASKRAAEKVVEAYQSKLNVIVTQAHNHFGPRQRPEWVVPDFVDKALRNVPIVVNSPEVRRDFSYVTDVVMAYVIVMEYADQLREEDVKGPYEIGSGVSRTMKEVATTVARLSGYSGTIQFGTPRTDDMSNLVADSHVLRSLGWQPRVEFEEGIRRTIEWYRQRLGLER